MTSPAQAKRTVVLALLIAGSLAATRDLSKGRLPKLRVVFGIFVAGVVLAALADFGAPELSASFAALIVVTAVLLATEAIPAVTRLVGGGTADVLIPSKGRFR